MLIRIGIKGVGFMLDGAPEAVFEILANSLARLTCVERVVDRVGVVDKVFYGYACYFGEGWIGKTTGMPAEIAVEILVTEIIGQGQLTVLAHSEETNLIEGLLKDIGQDVREHLTTTQQGRKFYYKSLEKCQECGSPIDPSEADKKGFMRCRYCKYWNLIPLSTRVRR